MSEAVKDIPNPPEPGTDGTQRTGALDPPAPSAALSGEYLPAYEALAELTASHPNKFGGVQGQVVTHWMRQVERDKYAYKTKCDTLERERDDIRKEKHALDIEVARLKSEVAAGSRETIKKTMSVLLGTTLWSLSFDALKNQLMINALILFIIGTLPLIYGLWFPKFGGPSK